jgi:RecA-family ATPase
VDVPAPEIFTGLMEWDAGDVTGLPPPREWLLGNQFCRRFLSGLLAPGATGKTALRTLQYLSLATGRPLTGQHIFKRGRVLLLSLEDDDTELQRRLAAARIHHGIDLADLKGWLFCATPKGIKLADAKDGARVRGPLEAMLRDTIQRRQIDLLGLDPFVKLHALEENDNGAMDFVCDLLVKLAIEFNIAVDVPHHTKKGQQIAGDADAGRGASSARDAGRLMYTLTRMTDAEGDSFGIPAEERRLYVRLDSSKVNIAPRARPLGSSWSASGSITGLRTTRTGTMCKRWFRGTRRRHGTASPALR